MTTTLDLAQALVREVSPFCDQVEILSCRPEHIMVRVKRKAEMPQAALFAEDVSIVYPFDEWCTKSPIHWSTGAKSKFWIGYLSTTRITFQIDK